MLLLLSIGLLTEAFAQKSFWFAVLAMVSLFLLARVITKRAAMICLLFFVSLWALIQSPPVQSWLVSKVTDRLSSSLHTRIRIGHVDFSFFNKMILQQTLVEDQHRDTLLYAGEIKVNITDWFFARDSAELHYIGLNDASVKLQRSDSVWNYQFLVDYFGSPSSSKPKSKFNLNLKKVQLANIHLLKKDGWRGEDMELSLGSLLVDADTFNLSAKKARLKLLEINEPRFSITNYEGKRLIAPPDDTAEIKNDPRHLRWNGAGWDITAKSAVISNGSFRDDKLDGSKPSPYFDSYHIYFSDVNWDFKQVRWQQDTITAQMQLNTRERSGLVVKKLAAQIKVYPEGMEFAKLDLQTGKSHLRNYFAMHYGSFDDMSYFISEVNMEGDFTDANVDSDDIAYFAPALRNWKKNIRITGNIRGSVDNLSGRNVVIEAGRNTLLNGDIHLKGLPVTDSTYIEFKSNDFRTTYADMITLVPQLKTIDQPRLDLLEYLRFRGTFNGFFKEFVTKGTIDTKLGTLVTDVNMKFPDYGPTIYSGSLNTNNFNLGKFLDNENLGLISFMGKIAGTGLTEKTLNAVLDGTVHNIVFNDYTYQDIVVKGSLAKKKFNGELIANDPNLQAELNGLIDFSLGLPRFDFNAQIAQADLRKLNFTHDQVEFNGKLLFNFTGKDIDNFLGTARVYDAAIFKNGERIAFDSLRVESSLVDSNKTITVSSNEFEGALVGEFSIRELPAAFQTFLNKYYPSYIKPAKSILTQQNFSFVFTTKKVDDYVDLFEKHLKGFNNTTVSGRINTKENLFDLNADVPQFNYKNIAFYNVNVRGTGNLDSLSSEASIGDLFVNDSLHFPNTHIKLHSFLDVSDVTITASANQTLNSASLSAQVRTLPDGVRIRFRPSVFDVNSKKWTIDKDGELLLTKTIVTADNLRIYSGDQQVLITTHPSQQGNWNDVDIDLKKINIGDFTPYFVKSDRMEGLLTGNGKIIDPFGSQQHMAFSGQAEQFRLNDDSVGKIDLAGNYDKSSGLVNATAFSDNKDYHFDLKGIFSTLDSSSTQPINISLNLRDTKIDLLEKYLGGIFSQIRGYASGPLQIVGPGNQLKYLGKLQLHDGKLKVNYTQVTYKIPSATVDMEDGFIDFGTFQIQDTLGHFGTLTRGRLNHHSFNDLSYDFAINTNKLLLLNTKLTDNNQFYGRIVGKANFTLTGKQSNMVMSIKGEPTDSSNIFIPSGSSRESGDADFIVWKVYGKEMQAVHEKKSTDLTVKLDITANNYANIFVVIDPLTNDIIKANGRGNLLIRAGTSEDLTINGRYAIDKGSYNFSFQSFIRKPFTFNPDADNFIQWTGDPYNADIHIEAVYEAENVSFSDLGFSSTSGLGGITSSNVKKYRGPILVTATLSDKLKKPDIAFQIELPANSPLKNDQDAQTLLQIIQRDPTELNKQVSFLVVLNQFGPLSNSNANFGATTAISGIFVNSISGVISNVFSRQFSSVFQKIFNDPTIKVNFNSTFYNGSNLIDNADPTRLNYDRTNLNLSIGKSFLNERLVFIFGSALDFGLSTQQVQAASFQFLPDITAEYKITPDGRFAFSLFYRDSYNYLSVANHTENRSGGSISYSRDFDRIDELFRKKKKDHPKPAPQLPADNNNP